MYGLFEYSYEYYEWENLICVSKHQALLVDHFHKLEHNPILVWTEEGHLNLQDKKTEHFMIKEVEELC